MIQRLHLPKHLNGKVWRYSNLASANKRHTHAELELNLITGGVGVYLLGQRRYQVKRGDLLWLFPAQEHVLIEQSVTFEMWIAVYRRCMIRRCAIDPFTRPLLKNSLEVEACRRLGRQDIGRLDDLFRELAVVTDEPGFLNAGLGYSLLEAWRMFASASDVPVKDIHPSVERAARLIDEDSANLSLSVVAQRSGLSASRLSRLFKQQTGFAMVDFRNRRRIERFLDCYGTGKRHTILDAALEAGFGSYAQFHRIFTRVMGCSPADYRRQMASQRLASA